MSNRSDLAILGGTPIRGTPLPPYNTIGEAERRAVLEVLESGELSGFVAGDGELFWGGPKVRALEAAFCRHFGTQHAVAVNSATSGLHCAVSAMGVGPGDEVIVPPYTMTATAICVLMTGAVPIFADIEAETFGLDPAAVEAAVTPQTKGIIAVNLFGHPADLAPLREIADRHGLFLVEDNAQAPDADYKGSKTGTIGDAGVFSFNRHKTMQSGEGGMVITDDETVALKAALMRNHGEFAVADMGLSDIVNTIGVNYRMTELEAAVAGCQFTKLPELNAARIRLADALTRGLSRIPGITPPRTAEACSHVYYFYVMKYDAEVAGLPRELFVRAVQAEGFNLRAGYVKPVYLEPVFQRKICFGPDGFPFSMNPRGDRLSYQRGLCPVTERLQDRDLMLTNIVYPPLTEDDMDDFTEACRKVLENRDALLEAGEKLAG